MPDPLRILILEDNPVDAELIQFELLESGMIFVPVLVANEQDYIRELQVFCPDLILSDYDLPCYTGALALAEAKSRCPDTPFILVTGAISEDRAIEILTQGAKDYVLKTRLQQRLAPAVRRALAEAQELKARKQAEQELREAHKTLEEKVKIRTAQLEAEMTERKKTEEALHKSEQYYRDLFNSMQEGFYVAEIVYDEDGQPQDYIYLDINPVFEGMMGLKRDQIVGKRLTELTPGVSPNWLATFKKVALTGEPTYSEFYSKSFRRYFKTMVYRPSAGQFAVLIEDITERKLAEERLQQSEERYKLMFETAPLAINITRGTDIIYANPTYLKMFGISSMDDLSGYAPLALFSPECRSRILENIQSRAQNLPVPDSYETECLRKDGTRFPVLMHFTKVMFADGPVTVGFIMDITERKQAEASLLNSKEQLNLALRSARMGTWYWDITTNKRYFDEQVCHLLGIDPQTFSGAEDEFFGIVHPDDRVKIRSAMSETIEHNVMYEVEYRVIWPDKSIHYINGRGTLVRDDAGQPVRVNGIIWDMTDQKQAEEKLREITERLHLATESAKAGVWDWNLQTNEMIWDDRMLELYGLTQKNFPGGIEAWEQGLHPDDSLRATEECQAALRGEKNFDTEFRVRHPDGKVIHIRANGLVHRDEKGNPLRMIGLNMDITEHKQAEKEKARLQDQLLQSQKMESVGRLAGGVAHDFNNMLGVILGHTELAMDQVDPAATLYSILEEISKAANRSADLTRQLLTFARKQTVSPQVLDLNETIAGTIKMLRRLIGEDIHLAWLPGVSLWPVKMDPSQIDQILANLCINARDAIDGVGRIAIETGNITFDEDYCANHLNSVPGEYALLTVSDDGCGMSREILNKLFEPFFTTKEVGKGTGLGLATVYGIVKQNNGFINVYSEPKQGTTIRIYLPRCPGKCDQPGTEERQGTIKGGQETILVVEDEPAMLKLCKIMLEKHGYRVLTAGTPGEAIQLAEEYEGEIHLLITDVVMPEINGRDLEKKILSFYPNLKRLFMSGYTADVIAHQGILDEGMNFIPKPFSKKNLTAKVRAVLDQKEY